MGGTIPASLSDAGYAEHLASLVDAAIAETCRASHRLVAVRMHHELARLARQDYQDLLKALAYSDEAQADS